MLLVGGSLWVLEVQLVARRCQGRTVSQTIDTQRVGIAYTLQQGYVGRGPRRGKHGAPSAPPHLAGNRLFRRAHTTPKGMGLNARESARTPRLPQTRPPSARAQPNPPKQQVEWRPSKSRVPSMHAKQSTKHAWCSQRSQSTVPDVSVTHR